MMFEKIIDKFKSAVSLENQKKINDIFNNQNITNYSENLAGSGDPRTPHYYIFDNDFFKIVFIKVFEDDNDITFMIEKKLNSNEKIILNFYAITPQFPFMEFDIFSNEISFENCILEKAKNLEHYFTYNITGKYCEINSDLDQVNYKKLKKQKGEIIDFISNNLNLTNNEIKDILSLKSDNTLLSFSYFDEMINLFRDINNNLNNTKNNQKLTIKKHFF